QETRFNVTVRKVRTMIDKGKSKFMLTRRGRFEGKRRDWKKAIVVLEPGYKIDIFENI
ncbi:50S ribosomal protein L23, partial [Candidatus Kryptobacter tengchongensis]